MVCLYCGKATQVVNSRAQRRDNHTWRRRACLACKGIFTTIELPDLRTSLAVTKASKQVEPFSRDTLFLDIHKCCAHRSNAIEDASALTQIIISKLLQSPAAEIATQRIANTALEVLSRYDKAAATIYEAYYS